MKPTLFLALATTTALFAQGSFAQAVAPSPQPNNVVPAAQPAAPYQQRNWSVYTASAQEIVRMQEAGIAPNVIRAYIQNANVGYKATVEDILFLHDHHVADDLVSDWIRKGSDLMSNPQNQAPARSPDLAAASNQQAAPAAAPQVQAQPQAPVVVSQQPTVVYQQAPPTVVYSSPSYVYSDPYPYYYTPPISIGFGYGWGRPYWGHSHYYAPVHIGYSHGFGGGWRGGVSVGVGGHFGGHHR